MRQTTNKYYVVYTQRLAGHLMEDGFCLMGVRPDDRYASRNVFLFKESPKLHHAISKYSASARK